MFSVADALEYKVPAVAGDGAAGAEGAEELAAGADAALAGADGALAGGG